MTHIPDSKAENFVKGFREIENDEFDIGAISHLHFGKSDEFIFDAVDMIQCLLFYVQVYRIADIVHKII